MQFDSSANIECLGVFVLQHTWQGQIAHTNETQPYQPAQFDTSTANAHALHVVISGRGENSAAQQMGTGSKYISPSPHTDNVVPWLINSPPGPPLNNQGLQYNLQEN